MQHKRTTTRMNWQSSGGIKPVHVLVGRLGERGNKWVNEWRRSGNCRADDGKWEQVKRWAGNASCDWERRGKRLLQDRWRWKSLRASGGLVENSKESCWGMGMWLEGGREEPIVTEIEKKRRLWWHTQKSPAALCGIPTYILQCTRTIKKAHCSMS